MCGIPMTHNYKVLQYCFLGTLLFNLILYSHDWFLGRMWSPPPTPRKHNRPPSFHSMWGRGMLMGNELCFLIKLSWIFVLFFSTSLTNLFCSSPFSILLVGCIYFGNPQHALNIWQPHTWLIPLSFLSSILFRGSGQTILTLCWHLLRCPITFLSWYSLWGDRRILSCAKLSWHQNIPETDHNASFLCFFWN